jgi:tetratricopeptide (TPR) repeat protein
VSDRAIFWMGLMSAAATIPLVQMAATAATAPEIAQAAKAITVKISEPNSQGSGVILKRQGDVYTVLTAAHVVKAKNVTYTIATPDGKEYRVNNSSIRRATVDIDLAAIEFRAVTNYPTAKLGNSNSLTEGMELYVGGFPLATKTITNSIFVFREGKVSANSNKTFEKGYSLVYSNDTLPGMSGGAVLNQNGELVAIHGRGDRETTTNGDTGAKTGFNLGIPISRFGTISNELGVTIETKIVAIPATSAPKPDDYIALGIQKFQKQDYRGALAEYNRAIQLNPNFASAYNYRGILKENKFGDIQGGLAEYNRAIQLDPNFALAHYNRGSLKEKKLGNIQSALADYNRAIQIDPKFALAYNNRGFLKEKKLGDIRSALADYNRAIQIDPNFANPYNNRGLLKLDNFGDIQGALADYNRAIQINPNFANPYNNRGLLKSDKLGNIQGALADYNRAIQIDPNYAIAYYNLGSLKENKLGDMQGALADYNRSIQLDPNYADTYTNRGALKYRKLNDRSGGISDIQQAVKLYKAQNNTSGYNNAMGFLRQWGAADTGGF